MLFNDNSAFLSELSKLFEAGRQTKKTVSITMKRYDGRKTRNPRKPSDKPKRTSKVPVCQGDLKPEQYKCLIRARLGDRKISVAIGAEELGNFQLLYSDLIRSNINLKKQKHPPAPPTGQQQQGK